MGEHPKLFPRRTMAEGMALLTGVWQVKLRQLTMPDFAPGNEENVPFHPAKLISNKALLASSWQMSHPLGSRRGRSLKDAGSFCLFVF